jgi:predicted amidophosphoribosyltransferase
MKNRPVLSARVIALSGAVTCIAQFEAKSLLLLDDLFDPGATMISVANALREQGGAKSICALALTKTGK